MSIKVKLRRVRSTRRPQQTRCNRQGQVAVEFAMIAPLVFLLIFGAIEFSRALLAIHCMEGAAHDGCRVGVVEGATAEDVEATCAARLRSGGITTYQGDLSPATLATAAQWEPVTVRLTTTYGDICWLPVPNFLGDIQLSASCTMPREAEPDSNAE